MPTIAIYIADDETVSIRIRIVPIWFKDPIEINALEYVAFILPVYIYLAVFLPFASRATEFNSIRLDDIAFVYLF